MLDHNALCLLFQKRSMNCLSLTVYRGPRIESGIWLIAISRRVSKFENPAKGRPQTSSLRPAVIRQNVNKMAARKRTLAAKDRNLHPVAILNSTARTTRWTGTASEKNAQFLRAKFEK